MMIFCGYLYNEVKLYNVRYLNYVTNCPSLRDCRLYGLALYGYIDSWFFEAFTSAI